MLRVVPPFSRLTIADLLILTQRGKIRIIKRYSKLIREGAVGNAFYLILEGKVNCSSVINKFERECGAGSYFGEAALCAGVRRQADVTAMEPCTVLQLCSHDLRGLTRVDLTKVRDKLYTDVLNKCNFFCDLPHDQKVALIPTLELQYYPGGSDIFRDGEDGDAFYVIVRGRVAMLKMQASPTRPSRISHGVLARSGVLEPAAEAPAPDPLANAKSAEEGAAPASAPASDSSLEGNRWRGGDLYTRSKFTPADRRRRSSVSMPVLPEETILVEYSAGAERPWFGELAIWNGTARGATARCIEPTELLRISAKNFNAFLDALPIFEEILELSTAAFATMNALSRKGVPKGTANFQTGLEDHSNSFASRRRAKRGDDFASSRSRNASKALLGYLDEGDETATDESLRGDRSAMPYTVELLGTTAALDSFTSGT